MTRPGRWWLVVAGLVLVLTAAGVTAVVLGRGGSPTDASRTDFCRTVQRIGTILDSLNARDTRGSVDKLQEVGRQLQDVGTPSDIPASAREGFERAIQIFQELRDDATAQDLEDMGQGLSDAEQANADAFGSYVNKTCGPQDPSTS